MENQLVKEKQLTYILGVTVTIILDWVLIECLGSILAKGKVLSWSIIYLLTIILPFDLLRHKYPFLISSITHKDTFHRLSVKFFMIKIPHTWKILVAKNFKALYVGALPYSTSKWDNPDRMFMVNILIKKVTVYIA